jgi:cell division protein ZapA
MEIDSGLYSFFSNISFKSAVIYGCCRKGADAVTGKNKVDIRISGKDYTVVGVEPEEYIQRVGLYIDRKMNEIMRVNNKLSTSMAAVLTAVNVADDYFKTHESESSMKKEIKKLSEDVTRMGGEIKRLSEENATISRMNSNLQLELAKREAELREVRNSLEKVSHARV